MNDKEVIIGLSVNDLPFLVTRFVTWHEYFVTYLKLRVFTVSLLRNILARSLSLPFWGCGGPDDTLAVSALK